MFWDYKPIPRMHTRLFILALLVAVPGSTKAQSTTSPYSILGIGDIENKDYGKFFGMASASVALRSASYVNLSNPASLTALDANMINIDINGRWHSGKFLYNASDTLTSSNNDAAIRRLSLTFRPGKIWGLSFGIKPYSSVNYLLSQNLNLQNGGTSNMVKTVTGSGGINQAYIANGFRINKNFSIGLTASYLFGSLSSSTAYVYQDLSIDITRKEYQELRSFQFQGGFQYSGKISPYVTQQFGITLSNPATLKGDYSTDYLVNDTIIQSDSKGNKEFRIPLQLGLGYALEINNKMTIAAGYTFSNWERQKLDYPNAYTDKAQQFSLGFQYTTQKRMQGQMREKMFFQLGVSYEKGYLSIQQQSIDDMSATAGLGSNLTRLINCYIGLEVGRKGDVNKGQIRESYTQISLGVTVKEFWYNTKKTRLYD
jgi:opacity protein-like surface antigen